MKLSNLRPCDNCKGKLVPDFNVIRISQALFTSDANRVLGMTQYMGGHLELGEMFAPEADDAILVIGDKEPKLMTEIFICRDCFLRKEYLLPALMEQAIEHKAKTDRQKGLIEEDKEEDSA